MRWVPTTKKEKANASDPVAPYRGICNITDKHVQFVAFLHAPLPVDDYCSFETEIKIPEEAGIITYLDPHSYLYEYTCIHIHSNVSTVPLSLCVFGENEVVVYTIFYDFIFC